MGRKLRSIGLRYGLPLAAFALLLLVPLGLKRWFSLTIDPTILVIALLIASAWYGGRGSGLLMALTFEATIDYFYLAGHPFTFSFAVVIFNRTALFVALALFASSRRHAEQQLRQQREQLREALEEREQLLRREQAARSEAEAANRLKDEFLATVSHELRTPLNAILGWASLLNRRTLDQETIRGAVSVIERNAQGQAKIIDDILDVSRIITGKLGIEPRAVELAPIIHAAIDTVYPAAAAKGITITDALDAEAGVVLGDPHRLQQIVWNLVSNAIKFTPKNGRIEIRLGRADSHVEMRVSDSGIGIDPQFLPYVFDRFRQADSSITREQGGLGLGLAIVRHLVELHGGVVAAESRGKGEGAAFLVRLPLADGRAVPASPLEDSLQSKDWAAYEPVADTTDLGGLRVLIVDDDADTRDILCAVLSQSGAEVQAACSSADALGALRLWKPQVLISDLGMPEEDGFALIAKVRTLAPEEGGDIPAAALTAYARDEDSLRARSAGYQIHISKPVDPTKLLTVVASLANRAGNA